MNNLINHSDSPSPPPSWKNLRKTSLVIKFSRLSTWAPRALHCLGVVRLNKYLSPPWTNRHPEKGHVWMIWLWWKKTIPLMKRSPGGGFKWTSISHGNVEKTSHQKQKLAPPKMDSTSGQLAENALQNTMYAKVWNQRFSIYCKHVCSLDVWRGPFNFALFNYSRVCPVVFNQFSALYSWQGDHCSNTNMSTGWPARNVSTAPPHPHPSCLAEKWCCAKQHFTRPALEN